MDKDYGYVPRNPVAYGLLSLACGAVGTFIAFRVPSLTLMAVVLGAIGMVVGGFSFSISNHFPSIDRVQYMGFAAAGIMASVIAFIFGMVYSFS